MKLWILSDLHLEGCSWQPDRVPDFDVLVAAGDIHDPAWLAIPWLEALAGGKPVVYVPGNHEWYAAKALFTIEDGVTRLREAAKNSGVRVLMDESVVLDGVRFLGSTLWTDYEAGGDARRAMAAAERGLNDHRFIYTRYVGNRMLPQDALAWHRTSRAWLETELPKRGDWDRTVVVTHHLPHLRSVDAAYRSSALNPAFVSDLSALVEQGGAALWVHGHTHSSHDYVAGGTRVVCNPKGYGPGGRSERHENSAFVPDKVVDLSL